MSDPPPRLLAYSHDGYGLGHLRRNLRISHGLRRWRSDVEVLLATGAKGADRLAPAYGIACVRLPSLVKAGTGRYEPADGRGRETAAVVAERSAILAETVRDFAPDVLLVDRHPRGLNGELDAALEIHGARRPAASTVLGLRDILDEPATITREWQHGRLSEVIERDYDAVLCYGDPAVYDPVAAYALPAGVARKIRYTGYLTDDLAPVDAQALRQAHAPDGRLAVCTLGGGQDGAPIASAFLQAMRHLREKSWHGVLITGPYMATPDVDALQAQARRCDVAVIRMATDVPRYLAAADAVLCMGGYNTTCEVLALRVPAVIVPRTQPRLEQLMRARALASRGLLHWLHPDGLTPRVLAGALAYVADTPRQDLHEQMRGLAHTGVHAAAQAITDLLPAARPTRGAAAHEDPVIRAIG
jgi:predicted glycosyltransferase